MTSINALNTGTFYGVSSGFFNSMLGGKSSGSSSMTSIFDYGTIKNGSYYKLMKAYYGGNSKISPVVDNNKSSLTGTDQKNAAKVRDSAKELKDDTSALLETGSKSLFKKKDIKKEDGTTVRDYDKDAIYKAVSSFVDSYNDTLDNAADSDNRTVLSAASNMVNSTKANKELLASVGISIGSNNKLTINEKDFKAADMSDVKSLFNGVGSYSYGVANSAFKMYNQSVSQLAQSQGASYNNVGRYNNYSYSGSLYSSAL